jgi:hypothetical protein
VIGVCTRSPVGEAAGPGRNTLSVRNYKNPFPERAVVLAPAKPRDPRGTAGPHRVAIYRNPLQWRNVEPHQARKRGFLLIAGRRLLGVG